MPPNTVYVGRPSAWGNPFQVTTNRGRKWAAEKFREWMAHPDQEDFRKRVRVELSGKNLACWCPLGSPCHADVLLEFANLAADASPF